MSAGSFFINKICKGQQFYIELSRQRTAGKGKEDSIMALTRKMLKAMGIEDDKIDQIIEAHTETVDGLKSCLLYTSSCL